jgi:hypothetical protein
VLLLAPTARLVAEALTLRLEAAIALVAALPMTSLLPHLRAVQPAGRIRLSAGLAAAGLGLAVAALGVAGAGEEQPRVDSLFYLLDADSESARWLSFESEVDSWTASRLGDRPKSVSLNLPGLSRRGASATLVAAEAPVWELAPPALEVLPGGPAENGSERRVEIRVRSSRGAAILRLETSGAAPTRLLEVDGRAVDPSHAGGAVRLTMIGVPPEGVRLSLLVGGAEPVGVTLVDQSYGLPAEAGMPPRPGHLLSSIGWQTDSAWVVRRFTL